MNAPPVYVVMLTWNRVDDTLACIASLVQSSYQPIRIIVCDNGSTDGTPQVLRTSYPLIQIIELGHNHGFAAGANVGLRQALADGADQILLINNDTIVAASMVAHLVAAAAPDVGIVAPMIYFADAPNIIWSIGGLRSPWTLEQAGDWRGRCDRGAWPDIVARDFVTGCAMLLSATALRTVGLFDERFFMYYEDSDLCVRMQRGGYRILMVPAARMWHKVARSSGGADSSAERYAMARSSVLFFRKHVRGWRWMIVGFFRLASAVKTTLRLLRYRRLTASVNYWRGLLGGWRQ